MATGARSIESDSVSPALDKQALLAALRALRRGDFSVRLPGGGSDGEIAEAFNEMAERLDEIDAGGQVGGQAQAYRMEMVGRLTGGFAHDFNNLLTVILGNAEMLNGRREDEAKRDLRIEAIRQAADRGRVLTRQLLAFARRQHLNPERRDVNALISALAPLLRQAVGDAVTVRYALCQGEPYSIVDRAQLETALLNLAVNARDAMPEGGVLSITTHEVQDGGRDWVEIQIADSGSGMSQEVTERAFEPFFTTKDVGLGSGLGLSQVYGFVNQSGGQVRLESTPGLGTVFHLRLPASPGLEAHAAKAVPPPLPLGGSEVVLVVEDDPSVLALTVDMLGAQGYCVHTAANAARALTQLNANPDIQVLFTDVTMPGGVSGVGLAREAQRLFPDLKVLLTSGFVGEHASFAAEFPMLDKPFENDDLARALRQVLDAPVTGGRRRRIRLASSR
jgi:signal transduction histidine kinase